MRRPIAILLLCIAALACHRKPAVPADVVARVGDRLITLADFKRYLERNSGTDLAQMGPEVASAMLDQYMEEVVLAEYAAARGMEIPAEQIAAAVRSDAGSTVVEKRDEMRRQKLIDDVAANVPPATDAEVRAYYEQHLPDFRSGEEVHVRQILVHDENLADQIEDKLKKGQPFEQLSIDYSVAPNAKNGGEIGFVGRGELPKMFEDEIFSLKPGAVSGVIRTDSSFHIFKVDERRPPGLVSLQDATPVIREKLKEDAVRNQIAELVAKARKDMAVAILPRRLPFTYTGTLPKAENE